MHGWSLSSLIIISCIYGCISLTLHLFPPVTLSITPFQPLFYFDDVSGSRNPSYHNHHHHHDTAFTFYFLACYMDIFSPFISAPSSLLPTRWLLEGVWRKCKKVCVEDTHTLWFSFSGAGRTRGISWLLHWWWWWCEKNGLCVYCV